MVAAANPLAAEAGRDILRRGGSAVDAAIAVQLVLGLVEPQSSGLGGGAFLLHWDATTGRTTSFDGRETAPSAARPDRFIANGQPMSFGAAVKSPLSIGVPGTMRLLEHVHRLHGKLPWADLFRAAISLAEAGFPVSARLHGLLSSAAPASFAGKARAFFFDAADKPWPAGTRLANPDYARTLRRLAMQGADAFYTGAIADEIVAAASTGPAAGSMTREDLDRYRVIERPPVCVAYRRHQVCSMGPPSSGAHTIGQALVLLGDFDLGRKPSAAMAPAPLHLIGEALKLAFADRNWYLADPAFVAIPPGLLRLDYLVERRHLISPFRPMPEAHPGRPPGSERQALAPDETREAAGTSHVSVIDGDGNALSMTTTIESAFGSGRWAAGFLLNNELTDFSFRPSRDGRPIANRVEAGKRPRSSMSPTIVLGASGKPVLVVGSAGGARIIPYVLKTIIGVIDWKLDAAAAVALPNFASRGAAFELEQPEIGGFAAVTAPAGALAVLRTALDLKPYGHGLLLNVSTSGTQLIVRRIDGTLEGAADPRREGVALAD
ncbi:MAG: gamma-glutamyltransferase [Hyphomicrobiaceae bacterium]